MYMQYYLSDRKYHNAEFLIMTGHVIKGAARVGVAFSDIKQQNVKHFAFEPLDCYRKDGIFGPFHKYIRQTHIRQTYKKGTQYHSGGNRAWESQQKPGGGAKAASLRALLSLRNYKRGMGSDTGISPAHISSGRGKG